MVPPLHTTLYVMVDINICDSQTTQILFKFHFNDNKYCQIKVFFSAFEWKWFYMRHLASLLCEDTEYTMALSSIQTKWFMNLNFVQKIFISTSRTP